MTQDPRRATSSRTTAIGQTLIHAVPRTVTEGDRALYTALYPTRFALASSDEFARACGLPRSPLDDLAAFHVVFGKTVPDVSLNAVANLGYAEGRFLAPGLPRRHADRDSRGDRPARDLERHGAASSGCAPPGFNQHGEPVLRLRAAG